MPCLLTNVPRRHNKTKHYKNKSLYINIFYIKIKNYLNKKQSSFIIYNNKIKLTNQDKKN